MNKEEFITELNDKLAILTEDERRDILDEYEQHIDIKVMRGMSEEAAIKDFGKIEELITDILEAYHVNSDYIISDNIKTENNKLNDKEVSKHNNTSKNSIKKDIKIWHKCKNISNNIWNFCKKVVYDGIIGGIFNCLKKIKTGMAKLLSFLMKPISKIRMRKQKPKETVFEKNDNSKNIQTTKVSDNSSKTTKKGESLNVNSQNSDCYITSKRTLQKAQGGTRMKNKTRFSITRLISKAIKGIVRLILTVVFGFMQLMWNMLWGMTGILFGFGSCITIFFMGMLAVLLLQGYPLTGITIGGIGLTLCMISVTIWCFSMISLNRISLKKNIIENNSMDNNSINNTIENSDIKNNFIKDSSIKDSSIKNNSIENVSIKNASTDNNFIENKTIENNSAESTYTDNNFTRNNPTDNNSVLENASEIYSEELPSESLELTSAIQEKEEQFNA